DIDALEISFLKSLDFKMHVTKEKYNYWLTCVRSCHRTGKHEYLFTKRQEKTDKLLSPLPKSFFNYDAKVINPPVGFERNPIASHYEKEYKLF
ncbi:4248_t:CDS:1, partial [Diversispora eburnea]